MEINEIDGVRIDHRYADLPGVRLHYVEAGTPGAPLVVLIHGFPEFWYSWRHQIPDLARRGYHVIAPDLRGYNLSGKPNGIEQYRGELVAGDIAALVRHARADRATIVGHDWGGGIAWQFASYHPDLLEKLVILNCPHPVRLLQGMRKLRQLRKSWYMFFFQLPGLPERAVSAGNFASLRRTLMRDPVRPGTFSPQDIERYVEAISQPGALTAAINYYRVLRLDAAGAKKRTKVIERPVLVIWGERDRYLGSELAEPPGKYVRHGRVYRIPNASHWVQLDAYEEVNQVMGEFLESGRTQAHAQA